MFSSVYVQFSLATVYGGYMNCTELALTCSELQYELRDVNGPLLKFTRQKINYLLPNYAYVYSDDKKSECKLARSPTHFWFDKLTIAFHRFSS